MKTTITSWIHYKHDPWSDKQEFILWPCKFENDQHNIPLFEHSFEIEVPDNFDPTPAVIEILRKEKARIQAEANVKAENIEMQIQELLCIEHKEPQ